jgi:tetratricopeptide (TPR) repeat protein
LIVDGKIEQASDVLNETFELLMTLLEFNPGDPEIEVRLGFLYKDLAQVFRATDPVRFRRHVQSGMQLFEGLVRRKLPRYVAESAWNGLGNMHLLTGDYERAIEYCSRATRLSPTYANAWADLFHAYVGLAEAGTVDPHGDAPYARTTESDCEGRRAAREECAGLRGDARGLGEARSSPPGAPKKLNSFPAINPKDGVIGLPACG